MNNPIDLTQYRKDARGALVPVSAIKPIDLARDDLIRELIGRVLPLQRQLSEFKRQAMDDVNDFIDMSVEQYGVKRSKKGNIMLTSFDGQYRILIANQDILHFDEQLQAVKALIDECLEEFTEGSRPELKAIVQAAFDVNSEGKINVKRVLGLRKLDIRHEKWQRAMQALGNSLHIQTSREYIRFYERRGEADKYELINLDIAGV